MKLYPASRRRGPNECENCRREFVAKPKRTYRGEKVDFVCPYCGFDNTPAYGRMAKAHGYDAALFDRLREPGHILTAVLGWVSVLSTLALLSCTPPAPASPLSAPLTWNAARTGNRPQGDVANYPSAMSLAATKTKPAPAAPVTRVHHDSKPEPTAARASTTESMCPRWREMSHWERTKPDRSSVDHRASYQRRQAGAGPAGHMESILRAIRHVETGGALRTPAGDSGAAIGPYQIHRSYWVDAAMPIGRYEDCRDRAYSEDVMAHYWARWCPQALVEVAWGILANTHHIGGPAARRGDWDAEYVQKVRAEMESA